MVAVMYIYRYNTSTDMVVRRLDLTSVVQVTD